MHAFGSDLYHLNNKILLPTFPFVFLPVTIAQFRAGSDSFLGSLYLWFNGSSYLWNGTILSELGHALTLIIPPHALSQTPWAPWWFNFSREFSHTLPWRKFDAVGNPLLCGRHWLLLFFLSCTRQRARRQGQPSKLMHFLIGQTKKRLSSLVIDTTQPAHYYFYSRCFSYLQVPQMPVFPL